MALRTREISTDLRVSALLVSNKIICVQRGKPAGTSFRKTDEHPTFIVFYTF